MARNPRAPAPSWPHMPGYGIEGAKGSPGRRFPWREIERRLREARAYWLVTTRPDGRPHAAPVWGAWLDGILVFDSGRRSRKTLNMRANPRIAIHLESAKAAVVLEGEARETRDRALRARFAAAYRSKYDWRLDPDDPPGVIFRFVPRVGFSWFEELGESATRWRFGAGAGRARERRR